MAEKNYHDQITVKNELKLRELQKQLPSFCSDFFRGIEPTTSSRTRIAYARDLSVFFEFLKANNPALATIKISDIPVTLLDQIKAVDLEEYMQYLKYYQKEGREYTNTETGIKRKLITLRSF